MKAETIKLLREAIAQVNKENKNSSIRDIQDSVANDLAKHKNNWRDNVVKPFYYGYKPAYIKYKHALKIHDDDRKQLIQMGMFALSLFGGSILSAMISRVDLGKKFDDKILNVLANKNMERTLKAYGIVKGNPSAQFILNQSVSQVKKWGTNSVKKSLEKVDAWSKQAEPTDPEILREMMYTMYNRSENVLRDAFSAILKGDKTSATPATAEQRIKALKKILNSPFCRAPKMSIFPDTVLLQNRILLGFYLKRIINSDFTEDYTASGSRGGASSSTGKRVPITESAAAKNVKYPTNQSKRTLHKGLFGQTTGVSVSGSRIKYAELGDNITKAINSLYRNKKIWKEANGTDLIHDGVGIHKSNRKANARAEYVLNKLNQETINLVKQKFLKRAV